MSQFDWKTTISDIHGSGRCCVIAITGGGSSAISRLLEVPGGSRTILEALVPYSLAALESWLGGEVDHACHEATARAMAMAAWTRARELSPEIDSRLVVGMGATASLASNRPKRGDHRVHVAVQTSSATRRETLVFEKGARDRAAEERLVAELILANLAEAVAETSQPSRQAVETQLVGEEEILSVRQEAQTHWTQLLLGQAECPPFDLPPKIVFAGSFNPPHAGHQQIVDYAAAELGSSVAYELSIANVDKPMLDFFEIAERISDLEKLDSAAEVLLTKAATFRKKAELFPGCTFLVGADTIARIGDPQYYQLYNRDGLAGMEAAIAEIAARGCRFLVFGREIEDRFFLLSDVTIPDSLRELCTEVPAEDFREDISSSELRQRELFD